MTGESKQLHTLSKEPSFHAVELGDNKSYVVRGLGSTSLKLDNGSKLHLNNILYVPSLKKNLLSISCLEDKGERNAFVDGKVLVWGKDSSIDKARVIRVREGSLYQIITPPPQALVHMEISPLSYGIGGCSLRKHTRKPFHNSETRSKEILDLIHSDVCGPMSDKSLGGHLYYVTFIDDHSRKIWLYLLKTKDEVFDKLKEIRAEVENLTERKIKSLRSDNGREYTSKELIAYCKQVGIKREVIVPYYPEQNGLAERKNRSIEQGI
eukprot:PITA_21955